MLNIARRNDIFIPAICYLSGCSPTLACRMCMVEADGKKVYSCNTKAKEGMVVESDLQNLWDERNEIMQAYCINPVSYTHLRAHETPEHLVCRLLLEKKK
ncbi:2Fe-2S iron-sulfur cluster-binding protein, partial [Campylobacter coli]|uniref:2Fe-2S iron-sulfur cluster-binding protein n=1 Tax=Campylobacter coli TaxID=195 RepID=UPI000AABEC06